MLDLQNKFIDIEPSDFVERGVPKFDDVLGVFTLLNKNLLGKWLWCIPSEWPILNFVHCFADAWNLLQIRPVYRKQQENFDRVLKCVTHLIYLLVATAESDDEKKIVSISRNNLQPKTNGIYRSKMIISGERKCQKIGKKSDTQCVHERYAVTSVRITTECYQKRLLQ